MEDDANVLINAARTKIRIFRSLQLLEVKTRTGGIQLEVESSLLND
jgi:hypothetical protein